MSQRLNRVDTAALVELSTLINLLALRGGSTNYSTDVEAAGLDADQDDFDADDGDSVSSEKSADTARLDELTEPHVTIRKRFLNRLTELSAAEWNGLFVTAAVFREVELEAHVDVWLARNNGFETPVDRRMVAATKSALNHLAEEQEEGVTVDTASRRREPRQQLH